MGCKAAAAQALQYRKADSLKANVLRKCDLLTDLPAWSDLQQLQTVYHQVLVVDLEYALDKKVEQELWTYGFKNYITTLQGQARDKKNPRRSEAQSLLSWCLESASGFYITLLQELCTSYDLDLPFCKRGAVVGQVSASSQTEANPPQTASCIYMCQYCLVHLGDLARYRNQRRQAESFYKHAVLLSPTSGQPYNQLALLETSRGNKLAAIFYYVQGIAVKNPFPATYTNLSNTFSAAIEKDDAIVKVQTKMSLNDFVDMFIKMHGLLYTATLLDQADIYAKSLNSTLTPLVATQSFSVAKLIQITIVNLYAYNHTTANAMQELTEDEKRVRTLVLDLIAGFLSGFLLPVYTLNDDCTILDYCALPAIKLIAYWIESEPEILKEPVFTTRLQIWPSLCKLLNILQSHLKDFDYAKYERIPLAEDKDLQGFLPLKTVFNKFDFKTESYPDACKGENLIRAKRLIDFGSWLVETCVTNQLIVVKKENGILQFEPGLVQPDPTTQLLEEMKSFNIAENATKSKVPEKRGGILKPQGSLEKSREERELLLSAEATHSFMSIGQSATTPPNFNKVEQTKIKRASQNVALQSIFKKIEENKQVKFDVGTVEKTEKPPKPPLNKPLLSNMRNAPYAQTMPPITSDAAADYFQMPYPNYLPTHIPTVPERIPMPNMPFPAAPDLSNAATKFPPPPIHYVPPANLFAQQQQKPSPDFPHSFSTPPPSQQQQQPPTAPPPGPYANYAPFQGPRDTSWPSEERQTWWPTTANSANVQQSGTLNYSSRDYALNPSYGIDYKQQANIGSATNAMTSPWGSLSARAMGGFEVAANQGMSLRQAMLKETKNVLGPPPPTNYLNKMMPENQLNTSTSTPGYSLFNSSSWSPNLPGQFRNLNNANDNVNLYPTQAPLQQLLEQQQNQLKKGNS